MSKTELLKRYVLFVFCLFFMGIGIAITKHGNLGVSPISSVAYVLSLKYEFLSLGNWIFLTNVLMLLGQIVILRRNFKIIQLLQIPASYLFGMFTDLGSRYISLVPNESYISRLSLALIGIFVLGFGITLGVVANTILNSGEALIKAISDTLKTDFANTKIVFDVLWVTLSILVSLVLFNGKIEGTREGTVLSALLVGASVKIFLKWLKAPLESLLKD